MMSYRTLWTCLVLLIAISVNSFAQKYNKYSDSYNYRKGLEALNERDYNKAESALSSEIRENSDNGYAYLYLGVIQYINDEYGKALNSINQAIKYIPKKDKSNRSFCFYKRAGIYNTLEKVDMALADYTQALSLDPEDEDILWERAQIYYEQKKFDLADADYKRMLKLNPNQPAAYMGLGRNEISRENYQNALNLFDNVVALYPDYSSGYAFRAEAYMGLNKYMEAASDIVTALGIDGDDKAFYLMQEIADSAFVQINSKLKAKAVTNANEAYWPYCLGIINEHTRRYQEAINNYLKAAKLDEDALTYRRISSCYDEIGIWTSAIEYIDKAITIDSQASHLLLDKANIYYNAGQMDYAISTVTQFIDKNPDEAHGYYRRGWFKDNIKDIQGAIEDYTTSITLAPEPYTYLSRGKQYLIIGENDLANADFEVVIQTDTIPEDGSCTMFALMHLGRIEEAKVWMEEMLKVCDGYNSFYEAACLYSIIGEKEVSLHHLRETLRRGYKSYHHIMTDDDLDNIRNTDEFKTMMKEYFPEEIDNITTTNDLIEYTERSFEIPFTRRGGVTQVKCNVNDLPLHFIFDTGAADVTISRVEATFMFKNGYLSSEDVIGKARYMDANGDISIGTVLNIKKITFGGLELENVRASVVESNNAPLLLGQSVLNRLGKIEIDYDKSILRITTKERTL